MVSRTCACNAGSASPASRRPERQAARWWRVTFAAGLIADIDLVNGRHFHVKNLLSPALATLRGGAGDVLDTDSPGREVNPWFKIPAWPCVRRRLADFAFAVHCAAGLPICARPASSPAGVCSRPAAAETNLSPVSHPHRRHDG
jgi:hypothetical protein